MTQLVVDRNRFTHLMVIRFVTSHSAVYIYGLSSYLKIVFSFAIPNEN